MESSAYYRQKMNEYNGKIRQLQNKKSLYNDYIDKLNRCKYAAIEVIKDLKNSEKCYLNGGYVVNGNTLDNGKLKNGYTKLEGINESIISVVNKTKILCDNMQSDINKYTRLLNEATRNYNISLAAESSM